MVLKNWDHFIVSNLKLVHCVLTDMGIVGFVFLWLLKLQLWWFWKILEMTLLNFYFYFVLLNLLLKLQFLEMFVIILKIPEMKLFKFFYLTFLWRWFNFLWCIQPRWKIIGHILWFLHAVDLDILCCDSDEQ